MQRPSTRGFNKLDFKKRESDVKKTTMKEVIYKLLYVLNYFIFRFHHLINKMPFQN